MVRGGTPNLTPKHKAHVLTSEYVEACAQLHRKAQDGQRLLPSLLHRKAQDDQRLLPSLLGDQRSPHTLVL